MNSLCRQAKRCVSTFYLFCDFLFCDFFISEMTSYIDERIFEELMENSHGIPVKFICEAPVGSGKSTAIKKFIQNHIIKSIQENRCKFKFIVIVPTINIAEQFASNWDIRIETPSRRFERKQFQPCVSEGAFKAFKDKLKMPIDIDPLIITTYSTATKCLGSMVEYFFRHSMQDKIDECFLIIDEAHLLLQNTSLIETIRDFRNVGLLSATPDDIIHFKVFSEYQYIKPKSSITYDRTLYIHGIKVRNEEILEQVSSKVEAILNTEQSQPICLVKVEDKVFCNKLKDRLKDRYKVYLYNSDTREVIIDDNGKFKTNDGDNENIQIVISTSCIQAGQSIKEENLISLFVQTPIDIVSNVQQFIGRNRCPSSQTHLYLRIGTNATTDKISIRFEHGNNRYKTKFNKLKAYAWYYTTIDDWKSKLKDYGKIICDESISRLSIPVKINYDDGKEYTSKKALYKHYNIKALNHIPVGYTLSQKWVNKNGIKSRKYKLIKASGC